MARLIVKRKREWMNWVRDFSIVLDDKKVGSVSNGDAEEFQLTEGDHRLKVKMDWCGSETHSFSISANQTYTVKICTYKYSQLILLAEIALLVTHIIVQRRYGISYIFWLVIPLFLCSLYYITLGRNSYLRIKEDEFSLSF